MKLIKNEIIYLRLYKEYNNGDIIVAKLILQDKK
jgi:hypothetical protein